MDTEHFTRKLEAERDKLARELGTLGKESVTEPGQWVRSAPDIDVMEADENEVADRAEEAHIDQIVLDELEMRYRLVVRALEKIENGTYGTCEVCGEDIEEDRLNANPAARTCKAHMSDESSLTL